MRIANKRETLARGLEGLGVLRVLERLAARPGLLVLTHHRIGDPSSTPFYAPVVSATVEALRSQLRHIRSRYRLLNLDEAVAFAEGSLTLREPAVLVTFDDGTSDNFEVAAPLLKEAGVPATFFLSTALINEPRLPWYDHLAYVLNRTGVGRLRLERPEPLEIDLTEVSRAEAIARLIRVGLAHAVDVNDEAGFLAHLDDRAEVAVDSAALGRTLFLSWDDARNLASFGVTVGSHAHTHRKLAALDEAGQREELATSKVILERELGREVTALAYPYGWPGAFDATTERLAREVGYRLAFASVEGVNRPGRSNPFALRRLGIGSSDSPVMLRARLALHAAFGRSPV